MELKAQKKAQEKERKLKQKEQKQSNMAERMAAMTPEEKAEKKALTSARLGERRQQDQLKKQRLNEVDTAWIAIRPAHISFLLGKHYMKQSEICACHGDSIDSSHSRISSECMAADQPHLCLFIPRLRQ